jgi:hypothetical protein
MQGVHEVMLPASERIAEDRDEKANFISSNAIVIAGYCAGRLGKRAGVPADWPHRKRGSRLFDGVPQHSRPEGRNERVQSFPSDHSENYSDQARPSAGE